MPRPAVFLDRDGTLIEDREYLRDPAGVRLLPGVPQGLSRLRQAGFALVVITNQSGIGRGWMTVADYEAVDAEFQRQLAEAGAALDGVYHCPAAPPTPGTDEHPERKPMPGLFLRSARDLDLDLARSYSVGDSLRDLIAARAAGCRAGALVQTGKPLPRPASELSPEWFVARDFPAAVDWILATIRGEAADPRS
jgi:histidinol-phosphate phosphatase family protein